MSRTGRGALRGALTGLVMGGPMGAVTGAISGGLLGNVRARGGLGGLFGTSTGPSYGEQQRAAFDAGSQAIAERFEGKEFTPKDVASGGKGAGYAGTGMSAVSSIVDGIAPPGTTASYTDSKGNTIGTVTAVPGGYVRSSSRYGWAEDVGPWGTAIAFDANPVFSYGPGGKFSYGLRGKAPSSTGGLFGAIGRGLGGLFGTVTTPARQAVPASPNVAPSAVSLASGFGFGAGPGGPSAAGAGYGGSSGNSMAGAFGLGGGGAHSDSTDSRGL